MPNVSGCGLEKGMRLNEPVEIPGFNTIQFIFV